MDRMSLGVLNFTAKYSNLMSEDEDQKVFASPSMAIMGWCFEVSGCPGFGESLYVEEAAFSTWSLDTAFPEPSFDSNHSISLICQYSPTALLMLRMRHHWQPMVPLSPACSSAPSSAPMASAVVQAMTAMHTAV